MKANVALALSFLVVSYSTAGVAQTYSEQERAACEPEVNRICSNFIPDRDRIIQCLNEKVKQLKGPCKKVILSYAAKAKKKK
jgi:hypothetical protein